MLQTKFIQTRRVRIKTTTMLMTHRLFFQLCSYECETKVLTVLTQYYICLRNVYTISFIVVDRLLLTQWALLIRFCDTKFHLQNCYYSFSDRKSLSYNQLKLFSQSTRLVVSMSETYLIRLLTLWACILMLFEQKRLDHFRDMRQENNTNVFFNFTLAPNYTLVLCQLPEFYLSA